MLVDFFRVRLVSATEFSLYENKYVLKSFQNTYNWNLTCALSVDQQTMRRTTEIGRRIFLNTVRLVGFLIMTSLKEGQKG